MKQPLKNKKIYITPYQPLCRTSGDDKIVLTDVYSSFTGVYPIVQTPQ